MKIPRHIYEQFARAVAVASIAEDNRPDPLQLAASPAAAFKPAPAFLVIPIAETDRAISNSFPPPKRGVVFMVEPD